MSNPYGQYSGPGYGGPPPGYPQQDSGFGPPRRVDSYGPPVAGGFQHGQEGQQMGAYGASNPQGNAGYYGPPSQNYPQPGYQPDFGQYGQPGPAGYGQPGMDVGNAEGDRGLLGAIGGGIAGGYGGSKVGGGHGFLGAIAGAIAGSKLEDAMKHKHHGGSSWGGSGGRW